MSTKTKLIALAVLLALGLTPPDKLKSAGQAVANSWLDKTQPTEVDAKPDADEVMDQILSRASERVPQLDRLTNSNLLFDYWETLQAEALLGNYTPSVTERVNQVWPAMEKALAIGEVSKELSGADRATAGKVFESFIRKSE